MAAGSPADVARPEPPFFTEEELDALYERNPVEALRISRRQAALAREIRQAKAVDPSLPAPTPEAVSALLEQARAILRRDGGDIEFVGLDGPTLTVRMTGNCAGCPRAALDLRHVVERLVRERFPQITSVRNLGRTRAA